ncbi:MAG: flagellar hook-length control protein FliK [Steroidobacteraceae bacterium]
MPQGTAQTAAAATNFSAALAQSLAATPAGQAGQAGQAENAATPNIPSSNATGRRAGDSSEPPAKHSGADPVSTALALLQNALAGALLGVPAVVTATAAATATSGTSQAGDIGAGSNASAALDTLLAQNSATDPKSAASPSASTPDPAPAASPTAATNAAATALTSLPLAAGSAVAVQHAKPDPTAMALSSSVGSSAWTDELGAKLTWMAGQGVESASLRLSPEHLGPLQVTISVHDGQASVWFGAAQPDTRTALQQSLPQLRQLFASQGLTLADAGVSREPPRGQTRQRPAATTSVATVDSDGAASQASIAGGCGLVDTYV